MTKAKAEDISRRDFLRLGWTLAAGVAVPPVLYGCNGSDDSSTPLPPETFVQPQLLASQNGVLDVTMTVAYAKNTLNGKAVSLRNINGVIPAPTLRLSVGETLRVRLVNQLPANPPSQEPVMHLRYPNNTNLHTHGLHVSPGLVAPGVYGDYVMDDPQLGVPPGGTRQHEYAIRSDHPPGAYWYHPHLHGATAIQVASGMAGALILKGDIDKVPEIAAAFERVFMFQAPVSNDQGVLESFTQVTDDIDNEPAYLINGVRRPRLVMRSGEVQNWHFINAAIFKFLNLALDNHTLNVYSFDGNTRANMKPVGPFTPGLADFPDAVVLAPGNRASVLVKAGAAGTYYLRSMRFQFGGPSAILEEDILAEVVVVDPARPMNLPTNPLPVPAVLAPITDDEFARAGGLKRIIFLGAIFNPSAPDGSTPPITDPPASNIVHPGNELDDWVYQTDNTFMANGVFAVGAASGSASLNPSMPTEYIPFQSSRAITQTVAFDAVEEWTIYNVNSPRHPFHIHVNPCWVTQVNGQPIEPYWSDTIALPKQGSLTNPTSVTFRSRFTDYRGTYVLHCHILSHEDMGMMQAVEVT